MKLIKILLLVSLILTSSALAYSNRDRILILFQDYEEECYQYKWIEVNKTQYFCDSNYYFLIGCNWCKVPDTGKICFYEKDSSCPENCIDCNCPKIGDRTVTVLTKTNYCEKYHLVRVNNEPI